MTLTDSSPLIWILLAILLWRAGDFRRAVLWLPCLCGFTAALLGASLFWQDFFALMGGLAGLLAGLCRRPREVGSLKPGDLALVVLPCSAQAGGQIRCRGKIYPARCADAPGRSAFAARGEIVEIIGEDGVFYLCQ